jgi:nitrogen-specific signal transduction histidine kinase
VIRDDGPGIPDLVKDKIFLIFTVNSKDVLNPPVPV